MNHKPKLLGSHISCNKKDNYLLGSVQETINNDANCFQFFTGPPQNKRRTDVSQMFLDEAIEVAKSKNISLSNCVVHTPYTINLATDNENTRDFAVCMLDVEIKRSVALGIKYIVLHPGFNTSLTIGIQNIAKNLQIVLDQTKDLDYFLCLETMAGKSNQIGKTLEEIKEIMDALSNDPRLAVCIDTCHLHDSGYDLSDKDKFLKHFDELIGVSKIKVLHLADSRNKRGSRRDVHANLGYGHVGFEALINFAYDEYLSTIPIIVETPYWIEYEQKDDALKIHKFTKSKDTKDMTNIVPEVVLDTKIFPKTTRLRSSIKHKLISPYKHEIQLIRDKKFTQIPYPKYFPVFDVAKS